MMACASDYGCGTDSMDNEDAVVAETYLFLFKGINIFFF
jgi:hypothetical protein